MKLFIIIAYIVLCMLMFWRPSAKTFLGWVENDRSRGKTQLDTFDRVSAMIFGFILCLFCPPYLPFRFLYTVAFKNLKSPGEEKRELTEKLRQERQKSAELSTLADELRLPYPTCTHPPRDSDTPAQRYPRNTWAEAYDRIAAQTEHVECLKSSVQPEQNYNYTLWRCQECFQKIRISNDNTFSHTCKR